MLRRMRPALVETAQPETMRSSRLSIDRRARRETLGLFATAPEATGRAGIAEFDWFRVAPVA